MKLLLLTLAALASPSAHASEFERRNAINVGAMRERFRLGQERELAEAEVAYIQTIAASLCLPASAVRGRYGDWITADGSIACGLVDGGLGGHFVRCLNANGADVGGFYVEDGRVGFRGGCRQPAKLSKPLRAKRKR